MNDLRAQLQAAVASSYEITRELTPGGMSRVFVARDLALDREVVIKVLPPGIAAAVQTERFRREIQIAARLQHPHIVPVLSAGASDDLLYYTMPLVEGVSLRQRMKLSRLSLLEALLALRDVADALDYSHKHGVVHRDIKPDNILLQSTHAIVVDFGVAKAISDAAGESTLTGTGLTLGTPLYIAPEQAMADADVDGRADIYSLGVVAYEMLSGAPPFLGNSPQALLAAHITREPVPLSEKVPGLRSEVSDVIARCLKKNPEERWQTAGELCEALGDLGARFTPTSRDIVGTVSDRAIVATPQAAPRFTRRIATIGVVTLAIAFVALSAAALKIRSDNSAKKSAASVAVLPFKNLDDTRETDYFASGISQEVRTELNKIEGLDVASGTSSSALSEKRLEVKDIGKKLSVGNVVEGTVRHAAGQILVTVQLTNARTGYQTWSSEFADKNNSAGSVQGKIALAIANVLVGRLVPRKGHALSAKPVNPMAFDLVLKGRYKEADFERASLDDAISHYQRALLYDSTYAAAHSAIADAYYHLADDYLAPSVAYPKVKAAALRAVSLDSSLASAHASLASYDVSYGWDWKQARMHLDRALALDPRSPFAHLMSAWYNVIMGDTDKATSEALLASSLDPYSFEIGGNVISILRAAGRHDLALSQIMQMIENGIGDTSVLRAWLVLNYTEMGDNAKAKLHLDSAVAEDADCCKRTRAIYLAHAGDTAGARKLIEEVERLRTTRYYRAEFLAAARAALGDTAATFRWLETAYKERSSGFPYFRFNPDIARLSGTAHFAQLQSKLRIPAVTRR